MQHRAFPGLAIGHRPFEAEHRTRDSYWTLTKDGRSEAADVLTALLREDPSRPRTFMEVVKYQLNLSGDTVPDAYARIVADQLDALTESRNEIKALVEERGEFQVRVTDAEGQPAIRGGSPCAFALLDSPGGVYSEQAQAEMTVAKLGHLVRRRHAAGKITDADVLHADEITADARKLLLNGDQKEPAA